jgi:hypothetical protein
MGCGGSTSAKEDVANDKEDPTSFPAWIRPLIIRLDGKFPTMFNQLEKSTLAALNHLRVSSDSIITKSVASFVTSCNGLQIRQLVSCLVYLFDIYLLLVLPKLEKFFSIRDQDEKFTSKTASIMFAEIKESFTYTLESLHRAFVSETSEASSSPEAWAQVGPRILRTLKQLFDLNASQTIINFRGVRPSSSFRPRMHIPPRVFHSKRLNRVFCIVCRAAWQGHQVGGFLPVGFARRLLTTLVELVPVPDTSSNEIAKGNASGPVLESLSQLTSPFSFLLDGISMGFLLHPHLFEATRRAKRDPTKHRFALALRRERVFMDLLSAASKAQLLPPCTRGADGRPPSADTEGLGEFSAVLLHPYFLNADNVVEDGMGRGLIKEVFDLGSLQFDQVVLAPEPGLGLISAIRGQKIATVNNTDADLPTHIEAGDSIVVVDPKEVKEVTLVVQSVHTSGGTFTISFQAMIPCKLTNSPYLVRRAALPVLVYRKSLEGHWLNAALPRSPRSELGFAFLGWFIACCILNRCQLRARLPFLFFGQIMAKDPFPSLNRCILEDHGGSALAGTVAWAIPYTPGPSDLRELDAGLWQKLADLRGGKSGDLSSLLAAAELPQGTGLDVYTRHSTYELLVGNTDWQMQFVRYGFRVGLGHEGLRACESLLTTAGLAELVCGSLAQMDEGADFDIQECFRVVLDPEARECPELVESLFEVLHSWSPPMKRKFLYFVSGLDRLPAPASEDLVLEMPFACFDLKAHCAQLGTLPQAHTCSNTLELPNWWGSLVALNEAKQLPAQFQGMSGQSFCDDKGELLGILRRIIHDRLLMAIENTQGYSLDEPAWTREPPSLSDVGLRTTKSSDIKVRVADPRRSPSARPVSGGVRPGLPRVINDEQEIDNSVVAFADVDFPPTPRAMTPRVGKSPPHSNNVAGIATKSQFNFGSSASPGGKRALSEVSPMTDIANLGINAKLGPLLPLADLSRQKPIPANLNSPLSCNNLASPSSSSDMFGDHMNGQGDEIMDVSLDSSISKEWTSPQGKLKPTQKQNELRRLPAARLQTESTRVTPTTSNLDGLDDAWLGELMTELQNDEILLPGAHLVSPTKKMRL